MQGTQDGVRLSKITGLPVRAYKRRQPPVGAQSPGKAAEQGQADWQPQTPQKQAGGRGLVSVCMAWVAAAAGAQCKVQPSVCKCSQDLQEVLAAAPFGGTAHWSHPPLLQEAQLPEEAGAPQVKRRPSRFPNVPSGQACGWCHHCARPELKKACLTWRAQYVARMQAAGQPGW